MRLAEILAAFAKLGVTSFGGPIAHIGFFRAEFVERRRWLGERDFADLVALCQFLPGPASSQVGFAIGLARGGILGALIAFVAFTLPSAVLLTAIALGASVLEGPIAAGLLSGLGIVAVAIVAHAVLGMARTLAPDARRAAIAAAAVALALLVPGTVGQLGALVLGAIAGAILCRDAVDEPGAGFRIAVPRWAGIACLGVFAALLVGLPIAATVTDASGVRVVDAFYRSGALVFGGGHVVLPLLESAVVEPGWVAPDTFLAGYGAAQAVPGPLFTVAAFLGASLGIEPTGIAGAGVALVAIFLPGFLLLVGVLPFWNDLRERRGARSVMRGANAAVIGILAAALYDPVFVTAITGAAQLVLAVVCFVLLAAVRVPPWVVVIIGAAGGVLLGVLGVG